MPEAGYFRSLWHKWTARRHQLTHEEEEEIEQERWELDMEGGLFNRPPTDVKVRIPSLSIACPFA